MRKINKKIRSKKNISMTRSAIAYAITMLMAESGEIENTKQAKLDMYYKNMEEIDINNMIKTYEYMIAIRVSQTNGEIFSD